MRAVGEQDEASRLHRMIAQGEHVQQDFKYKVEDAPKLAHSVSAFANTDGGRLLIGVRDDGSIHGVRSEEEIYMMHAAAFKFCTPEPTLKFETLHVPTEPHGGRIRTVVVCTVMPSEMRPVLALEGTEDSQRHGTAYVRIADENIVASPVHLALWRLESRLRGETFHGSDEERALLAALEACPDGVPLNRLVKSVQTHYSLLAQSGQHRLSRSVVVHLLARFIRFGLARMERRDQAWLFLPAD